MKREHTGKDLSGVFIDHSLQELQEGKLPLVTLAGQQYVMTLADTSVLDASYEGDVLENEEL